MHDEAWYIKIVRVNIYLEQYVLVYQITILYDLAFNKGSGYFAGPGKIAPGGYFAGPGKIRQNSL